MSTEEEQLEYLEKQIREYPDFPKKGILFRDIFGALTDAKACLYLRELLVRHIAIKFPKVELIIGLEARGFLLNLMLATELGIGCAVIRKKGKLPGEKVAIEYQLEYGTDIFEIQKSSIKPGQQVIIVDDLLATGGTLDAACQLISKVGGVILESVVIMELAELQGRKKLNCDVHSLLKF